MFLILRSVGLVFETCVVIGHLRTCRFQKGFQVSGLHQKLVVFSPSLYSANPYVKEFALKFR